MPTTWISPSACGGLPRGQTYKRRLLATDSYLHVQRCPGRADAADLTQGLCVRLPHVLTSLRQGERGVVDEALASFGWSGPWRSPRRASSWYLPRRGRTGGHDHARETRPVLCGDTRAQPQPGTRRAAGRVHLLVSTLPTTTIRRPMAALTIELVAAQRARDRRPALRPNSWPHEHASAPARR